MRYPEGPYISASQEELVVGVVGASLLVFVV